MSSSSKKLNTFLQQIVIDYPVINFKDSSRTHWDPNTKTIYYNIDTEHTLWSIIHELGHAKNNHSNYKFDLELLRMESEAWQSAKEISNKYKITIDDEYIQDCLDSYRDWLHKRSQCPSCSQAGIQNNELDYKCINCGQSWKVTRAKFCRTYRRTIKNT